jgi:hypothetical protein
MGNLLENYYDDISSLLTNKKSSNIFFYKRQISRKIEKTPLKFGKLGDHSKRCMNESH